VRNSVFVDGRHVGVDERYAPLISAFHQRYFFAVTSRTSPRATTLGLIARRESQDRQEYMCDREGFWRHSDCEVELG